MTDSKTTLEEARSMAYRNEPLPEEFYIDMEGEVQFKRRAQTDLEQLYKPFNSLASQIKDLIEQMSSWSGLEEEISIANDLLQRFIEKGRR